jgi:catechol 2,3-dioxygenase-like lactoylglutathione lyase family enzyme
MTILDHFGINVSSYERSKAFYEKALAPLGIQVLMEFGTACGFGRDRKPELWISQGTSEFQKPEHLKVITPVHVALLARSRAEVDAFHKAALAAGATDNGPPGIRKEYHPTYYGAFVLDPDGHNVEAVIHTP